MNLSWILNRARKAAEAAGAQAEADEKAARIAKETARAAKTKLKFARKLAKLARRAAKSARRKAAESFDTLERAREKLKELEKRATRDNPGPKPSRTRHRAKAVRNSSAKRSSAPAKPVAVLRSRVQTKRRGAARKQPVSPAPAARKARSPRRPKKTHRPIIATPGGFVRSDAGSGRRRASRNSNGFNRPCSRRGTGCSRDVKWLGVLRLGPRPQPRSGVRIDLRVKSPARMLA